MGDNVLETERKIEKKIFFTWLNSDYICRVLCPDRCAMGAKSICMKLKIEISLK